MKRLSLSARKLILTLVLPLSSLFACHSAFAGSESLEQKLSALEKRANGRIGMALIESGSQRMLTYRGDERFAMASTFKALLAGAVLQKSVGQPGLLSKRVTYDKASLVVYSPVTEQHLEEGMTVSELCKAAVEWSDNSAANLLLKELGGPASVTQLAMSLGDDKTRLDRWEPELNSAIPGDERDTSTPLSMARNLLKLTVADGLPKEQQQLLVSWLKDSKTGAQSIRAGVPGGWPVGDKTGAGEYGTTNDLAIIWPPTGQPLVLAIYFTQREQKAQARRDVLASVSKMVLAEFTGNPTKH
ncbi:class A beta-lactamase [Pseudomonas sp. Fl5BN2]|uniref:class A beta-lactamase n=1 Tax=unclassified Pseudomonas TaxID=196821 RepID=UPI0013784745|nr:MULTISPECIES: class A beta-lactamase [unclassified Pseudomonas]NBF02187.1 class A beta-lactamase [Pseudomonas sp. Fl5BN2]NBF07874.1 class A beta-lactamase [Pseudomonas sp. Fl4BN1]